MLYNFDEVRYDRLWTSMRIFYCSTNLVAEIDDVLDARLNNELRAQSLYHYKENNDKITTSRRKEVPT